MFEPWVRQSFSSEQKSYFSCLNVRSVCSVRSVFLLTLREIRIWGSNGSKLNAVSSFGKGYHSFTHHIFLYTSYIISLFIYFWLDLTSISDLKNKLL